MEIVKVFLTSVMSAAALFIVTKIMEHKQVAQLDLFDYISGITIGSIGAELATDPDAPWTPLTALIIYGAVSAVLSLVTHKFPRARKYVNGTPTILLDQGKLYRKNFKKAKLDLSEFLLLCREQGYFDLNEIQTAIFEHNGKLSILPKSAKRPATPSDLNVTVSESFIGVEIIMDGRIMGENLTRMGKDVKWLKKQLAAGGFKSEKDILLAVCRPENDSVTFFPVN